MEGKSQVFAPGFISQPRDLCFYLEDICVILGQNFSRFLENQHSIPRPKCEDNNQKSVNYFHRFWSNYHPKYGDNNQKWQNFRVFLKYQHTIPQPKCEEKNQKSTNYFYRFWSNPKAKYGDNNKKNRTLEDFWNKNIQILNQNVKTNTQLLVLQLFCDSFTCTISPQQIRMFYFP